MVSMVDMDSVIDMESMVDMESAVDDGLCYPDSRHLEINESTIEDHHLQAIARLQNELCVRVLAFIFALFS